MKNLWSGRFKDPVSKVVEQFTESISFDFRLWPYDIAGSTAHVKMLAKQGLISHDDEKQIIDSLESIKKDIENDNFTFKAEHEDIHMNIETVLIERAGQAGKKIHTARSRNDQVALDIRLYLKDEIKAVTELIRIFQLTLLQSAKENLSTIMPGYTHLQRAQPVTLAHHLMAYVEMFDRDRLRYSDSLSRLDVMPLGACALSGTSLNTDRQFVCNLLSFKRVSRNSIDAVSDRDFIVEFISNSSILFMHLSRMAEELVLWFTKEFSFINYSDSHTTGSSIMPQKKNPDVLELIRGKTGRIYGALISILTTLKALPLAYNRDLQEDKPPLFDTVDTVKHTLIVINNTFKHIEFNKALMGETSKDNFSLATDIAEYLVEKGVPFRSAHEVVGTIVRYCIESNKTLEDLTIDEYTSFSKAIEDDIFKRLTPLASINNKKSIGSTSIEETKKAIKEFEQEMMLQDNNE